MYPRIKKFFPRENFCLEVEFDDIKNIPSYSVPATTYKLFEQVQLDSSRTCIYRNEEVDLPSDAIYEFGKLI